MFKGFAIVAALVMFAEATGIAFVMLFGQVDLPQNMPVKFDVNNLTAVGVLAWYAWHNAAKVLPKMVSDNRNQVSELTSQFLAEQTRSAAAHDSAMKSITERYMVDLAGERRQFGELIERERRYHAEQMELLRGRVHDMADQANESMLKVIMAIEQVAKIGGLIENGKKDEASRKHETR